MSFDATVGKSMFSDSFEMIRTFIRGRRVPVGRADRSGFRIPSGPRLSRAVNIPTHCTDPLNTGYFVRGILII